MAEITYFHLLPYDLRRIVITRLNEGFSDALERIRNRPRNRGPKNRDPDAWGLVEISTFARKQEQIFEWLWMLFVFN